MVENTIMEKEEWKEFDELQARRYLEDYGLLFGERPVTRNPVLKKEA